MMKMKLLSVAGALSLALGFISCEKANDPEYLIPSGEVNTVALDSIIYSYRTYVDLSTNEIVAINDAKAWDLSIQTYGDGSTVYLNSALPYFVSKTSSTDINENITISSSITWLYDMPTGDPATTAFGDWQNGEVYLLGVRDLTIQDPTKQTTVPKYKISFEKNSAGIVVKWADLTVSPITVNSATLAKTKSSNPFTWFSFSAKGKADVQEPSKDNWDIVFTPYINKQPDDQGNYYPYLVNGILTNRYNSVSAYRHIPLAGLTNEEYNTIFTNFTTADPIAESFSNDANAVGYDWKAFSMTTYKYVIDATNMYFVKDASGHIYKLRMTDFYTGGKKGIVTFEYALLASPTK
jgi:hypothetical protein